MTSENGTARILICDAIAQVGIDMLQEHFDVDVKIGISKEELLDTIDRYQGVVVRSATKIGADVLERASHLEIIGRAGAGLDNIDVAEAQARGIKVVNCPDANTVAVAEHTMALLLGLVRHLPKADVGLKAGRWEKKQLLGMGLTGKVLGIIGFGRIGREVAIRAKAFGMKVLVNQRRPTPELNAEFGVEAVDMNLLLQQSDFVTLHVPARPETENLIKAEQLAMMRSTAYLINTARGTVIDEEALLEAVEMGQIAGAALDVFLEEPATNNKLAQHPKVIATPHIAASTQDAQQSAAMTVARHLIDFFRDEPNDNPLNLRVVSADDIYPHEQVDPRRISRLAKRLEKDDILANPPIVYEADGKYIVLDGATRTTALKEAGFPHAVVQLVTDTDTLTLDTWYHAIRKCTPDQALAAIKGVSNLELKESNSLRVWDDMFESGGVCYVHTVDNRLFVLIPKAGSNHLEVLNELTQAYIDSQHVTRSLNSDVSTLQEEYPDLAAVVVFPTYTVEQVLQIAQAGSVLPAGITRFLIAGRVLRINASLAVLKSDQSLSEKQNWLNQQIQDKIDNGRLRYYEEPVYLLDE